MTQLPYADFVKGLCKPGTEIVGSMTPHAAHLIHMTMGVSGEAGELLDAIKKHTMYNKPLDVENVIEEIGDVLFYLTGIANVLGFTLDDCAQVNAEKLSKRYSEGKYSDKQAQERADKTERKFMTDAEHDET